MFQKYIIKDYQQNLFQELSTSIKFEDIIPGRKGTNIVNIKEDGSIPIVRTTAVYNNQSQPMLPIHHDIIEKIRKVSNIENLELNNALVEIYDNQYRSMRFHTDQSLDLKDDSYICIFSCYKNGDDNKNQRKLFVKNKESGDLMTISLPHNSVLIFSTKTNQEHLHKIVLDTYPDTENSNEWLGITFRCSKRFIKFVDNIPYLYPENCVLRLADEDERKAFAKEKGNENKVIGHVFSHFDYTVSPGDLIVL